MKGKKQKKPHTTHALQGISGSKHMKTNMALNSNEFLCQQIAMADTVNILVNI